MRVFTGFDGLPEFNAPVVTVGSYDGVHRGHRVLLDRVVGRARETGGESVVVTFSPHPREVLDPGGVSLLTTLPEKVILLERTGIDNLIVIPFDRDFSRITYDRFVSEFLVRKVGMKVFVGGYNHHFGKEKEGRPDSMPGMAERLGFEYFRVDRCDVGDSKVSSTVVRECIGRGEMAKAAELLGYNYFCMGVAAGECVFIPGSPIKLLPPAGAYAVEAFAACRTLRGTVFIDEYENIRLADPLCRSLPEYRGALTVAFT